MDSEAFDQAIADALLRIPRRFRRAMSNIAIIVEDEPSRELLRHMGIRPPGTLLGLYQGTPLTMRGWDHGNTLPDRILIFRGPHERAAATHEDLTVSIAETLVHEIGHYFGLSEAEIRDIENRYWHGRENPEP